MASIGYKPAFADGRPTHFKDKILTGINSEVTAIMGASQEIDDHFSQELWLPKIHTIRQDAKDMWYPGRLIHHCYGNRTKQRDCFLVNTCVSIQRIQVLWSSITGINLSGEEVVMDQVQIVMVDGRKLNDEQVQLVAVNDGFDSAEHFFTWFDKDFSGKIIHWTKHRY